MQTLMLILVLFVCLCIFRDDENRPWGYTPAETALIVLIAFAAVVTAGK